jgi:hypothetical protein
MSDRHAEERERKRHKRRYGPTTTNPGLPRLMRELAHKAHEGEAEPLPDDRAKPTREQRAPHPPASHDQRGGQNDA